MNTDKNSGGAGDSESRAKDAKATIDEVLRRMIFFGEESLKNHKKIETLAGKLYRCAGRLAETLVELDNYENAGAFRLIAKDKLCRKYAELKEREKKNIQICQENLEYYHEVCSEFAGCGNMSESQRTELLNKLDRVFETAIENAKATRENLAYWQEDYEDLQRDCRKNQIKLLKRQIAEYKRKLPAAEKKLSRLLEQDRKK